MSVPSADIYTYIAQHLVSFAIGVCVGLALSSRYRVVRRRNGQGDQP